MPTLRRDLKNWNFTDELQRAIEQHCQRHPNEPFGRTARRFGVSPHTIQRFRLEAGIPAPAHPRCPACLARQVVAASVPVESRVGN